MRTLIECNSGDPARKRAIWDLGLAGCICLAALGYWFWSPAVVRPDDAKRPAATAEPQHRPVDGYNDAGYRFFEAANYAGAEAQFRQAIGADPKSVLGHCNLGAALIAQRKYDAAIGVLRTATALDPSFALAQNNLNWALEEKRKNGK